MAKALTAHDGAMIQTRENYYVLFCEILFFDSSINIQAPSYPRGKVINGREQPSVENRGGFSKLS